jgi:hypothetical protein
LIFSTANKAFATFSLFFNATSNRLSKGDLSLSARLKAGMSFPLNVHADLAVVMPYQATLLGVVATTDLIRGSIDANNNANSAPLEPPTKPIFDESIEGTVSRAPNDLIKEQNK